MPRTDTFTLPDEQGTAEIIQSPNGDTVDAIGNLFNRASVALQPFDVVNFTLSKMLTDWDIKDPDTGGALPFPKAKDLKPFGQLPGDIRKLLFDECWRILEPLIPNFQRGQTGN